MNKAVLAEKDGTITDIEKAPQGGYFVYVDKEKHYIAPNLRVLKRKGDTVERGDILSEGIPKPDEVVRHKGLGTGRLYMVNTLQDLYKNQGKDLDARHFEILAKSSMNHVRILDDPSHTFIKGDVISYNALRNNLGSRAKRVAINDALGETLGAAVPQYAVGTRITSSVLRELKRGGLREVAVAPRAPDVEFVMKSATNVPKMNPDWLARMAHQGLKPSLLRAAHMAEKSDIHGTHPVPAYVYGVEFGEGSGGRY
jgi:hypothetical protein